MSKDYYVRFFFTVTENTENIFIISFNDYGRNDKKTQKAKQGATIFQTFVFTLFANIDAKTRL